MTGWCDEHATPERGGPLCVGRPQEIVEEVATARPGVLELMDEAIGREDIAVGICSAATLAGFEKVVNSVVGPELLVGNRCSVELAQRARLLALGWARQGSQRRRGLQPPHGGKGDTRAHQKPHGDVGGATRAPSDSAAPRMGAGHHAQRPPRRASRRRGASQPG